MVLNCLLQTINVHCPRDMRRGVVNNQVLDWSFKLDGILHNSSQDDVYSTVCSSMVTSAMQGYNGELSGPSDMFVLDSTCSVPALKIAVICISCIGTVMCYGQTGAGKTFTMTGATENYKHRGLIPRAIAQVFREIDEKPDQSITIR